MSAVQLEGLWQYLQSLSLTKSNKQWLSEHLTMPSIAEESPNQKYVRESLTRALKETREAIAEGRSMPNAYDLLNEL